MHIVVSILDGDVVTTAEPRLRGSKFKLFRDDFSSRRDQQRLRYIVSMINTGLLFKAA